MYQCEKINSYFDKSLNHINHMLLAAGQISKEVHTLRDMLKEDDHVDLIKKTMDKEVSACENRTDWEVITRSSLTIDFEKFKQFGHSSKTDSSVAC